MTFFCLVQDQLRICHCAFQLILGDANINSAGKVGDDGLADLFVIQLRTSMIIHDILQEQVISFIIATTKLRLFIVVERQLLMQIN